ncbi:MAG: energy transducer TonB [bacterium]|nr:TonB family protein [Betaproteobacteria bacterium]
MASLIRLPNRYPAPEALFLAPPFSYVDPANRTLMLAVIASVLLHATLMATGFIAPGSASRSSAPAPLEVVLVNARTEKAPVKADVRAQSNLDGGGNTDAKVRAKTPLPQTETGVDAPDPAAAARARVEQLEAETQRVMARIKATVPIDSREPNPGPQPVPQSQPVQAPSSAELAARSLEMARLRAEISKDFSAYQERPRKAFVGARASEDRFARYVEDWRGKIERVGNLNYPDEARRQKLYGTLVLTVSVRRDGTVESIEVNRSSGFRLLDQAAIRIVELAAPFSKFPPDIAKDIDILAITRTWSFTTTEQFQGQ